MNFRPPLRLIPVEPLLFRSDDGGSSVAFQADSQGRITRIYLPFGLFVGERLAWYENPAMHMGLALAVLLLALSVCVLWPAGALVRRLRGRTALPAPVRTARWIGGVVSALLLAFLATLGGWMASAAQTAVFGAPPWLNLLLCAPLLATVLAAPLVWATVRACRAPGWALWGKLHLALLSLGAMLFIPFLYYWNLLGFQY